MKTSKFVLAALFAATLAVKISSTTSPGSGMTPEEDAAVNCQHSLVIT